MRIALVHPHSIQYHHDRDSQNIISGIDDIETFPNLALLSLASYIPGEDEAEFIDEDRLTLEGKPLAYLDEDFDLVCLTAMNHQALRAYEIADRFRSRGIPVIMGGFHASALPGEAGMHADAVAVGEGEDIFPLMLDDARKGNLKPVYTSGGKVDLSFVPPPALGLVKGLDWYTKIPLFATRGCSHDCNFCCLRKVYGPKYRKKPIDKIVEEIKMVKELLPDPFISFADENMLVDCKYGRELAKALIPLGICWECYCDSSVYKDEKMLDLLAESGCEELIIGFESVLPGSLEEACNWKREQGKNYLKAIRTIQEHGIGVLACFVVGFDHDDSGTFARLRDFIEEALPFELDAATLTPMPGTPLYERLKSEGRILSEDWRRYSWFQVNFKPKNLTPKEIMDGLEWLHKEYNSPRMRKIRRKYFSSLSPKFKTFYGAGNLFEEDENK
ncbi:MAG: B12-binding domain-containing radical SAM protein [Chloroflexi bacterium]|nr:B12-binding domain-containing radical SAM protein [Chloroflexota bacterium]